MADMIIGWNDSLPAQEDERKDFTVLPEGDYWFLVKKVNQGTAATDGCPMAEIEMLVKDADGNAAWVVDRIKMIEKMIWKLQRLFTSIGLRSHGEEQFRMNWNAVPGSHGYATFKVETITQGKRAGEDRNELSSYLDMPKDAEPPAWCVNKAAPKITAEPATEPEEEFAF